MNKVMNKIMEMFIFFMILLLIPTVCFCAASADRSEINSSNAVQVKTGSANIARTETDSDPSTISVVYCSNIAPFEFTNQQGKPDGLMVDFWKLWEKKTKIHVQFKPALWKKTLEMVRNGEADAHAGLFYNKKRGRYLDYSRSLSQTSTSIFLSKNIVFPETFDNISAYRIGVIKKDFVEGYMKKHLPGAAIVEYDDYGALIKDLKSGTLKVFAADTATGLYYLGKSGIVSLFHFDIDAPLYTNKWYVAVKKGQKPLLDLINSGLALITPAERKKIERRWISGRSSKDKGAVIVAVPSDYPPLSMIDTNGEASGFFIDLWRQWGEIVGKPVKFRMTNWADTLKGVKEGYADVHSGLFINDERKTWLDFSIPLLKIDTAIYFKSDALHLHLNEMSGRRIGIIKGSYQVPYIKKLYPRIRIITYLHLYDMISALLDNKISAIVTEVPEMTGDLQRMGLEKTISMGDIIVSNAIHPGVLKKNKKLFYMVNHGFALMPEKTLLTLKQRWLPHENDWKKILKWPARIGTFMVILIFAGFLWNYKLRSEIIYRREMTEALEEAKKVAEEAKKQAEQANNAKSLFLANMSHEIRTPMSAILGMNKLALETSLTDRQRYLLENVQSSSSNLLMLLNDILDFSKIEAGKLDIRNEPFSLNELLDAVYSSMNPQIVDKGLEFKIHEIKGIETEEENFSQSLVGDKFRIRQILYNLIGNSLKFTEQGAIEVTVQISKYKKAEITETETETTEENKSKESQPDTNLIIDDNKIGNHEIANNEIRALFCVSDTGIGIPPEKEGLIFDIFQQADTSIVRKFGGSGLGLTICRQLVDLLGGKIWVKSTPGKGTKFFFTLKLGIGRKTVNENLDNDTGNAASDIRGLNILMVEDNAINQELFEIMLQKYGHYHVVAGNGLSALEKLSNECFDMIFMDVQMPVMDGITACRIIRALEKREEVRPLLTEHNAMLSEKIIFNLQNRLRDNHIPIVAITANAMGDDREKCFKAGMDGYITKPFVFKDVRNIIKELCRNLPERKSSDAGKSGTKGKNIDKAEPDYPETAVVLLIRNHLSSVYNLNDDQIDSMVVNAGMTLSENFSSAVSALQNNDYEMLRKSAHSIKGSLLNLGLNDIAEKAKAIEMGAKEKKKMDFSDLLTRLEVGLKDLLNIVNDDIHL